VQYKKKYYLFGKNQVESKDSVMAEYAIKNVVLE
jgi:hypothetical protein